MRTADIARWIPLRPSAEGRVVHAVADVVEAGLGVEAVAAVEDLVLSAVGPAYRVRPGVIPDRHLPVGVVDVALDDGAVRAVHLGGHVHVGVVAVVQRLIIGVAVLVRVPVPQYRRIEIRGYADYQGDERFNLWLSQRRADRIRNLLIDMGIAPERIEAIGFGEADPLVDGQRIQDNRLNRRVEFVIVVMWEGLSA